jgi:NDP-sugar pyrophosphorylase family protein
MDAQKTVIILCGGRGTRVQKYFPGLIKPLFPINNVPIIERQILMFKDYTIFINCNEEDKERLEYLHLPLLCERTRVGNAGALLEFQKELGERFFIIHCDELTDLDPNKVWDNQQHEYSIMTMVIKNIAREKEFGLVITKDDKIITCTKERWVNTGMYVADKRLFEYIEENKIQDLDNDVFPKLIKNDKLGYYKFDGYWQDIGVESFIKKVWYAEQHRKK